MHCYLIEGWEKYQICADGYVYTTAKGKQLKPLVNPVTGYCTNGLSQDGERYFVYLHHLVAKYFMEPKPTSAHELDHKDKNKQNNTAGNLEWVTRRENMQRAYDKSKTTSQFYGVYFCRKAGKWKAQMNVKSVPRKHLGNYNNELDAARAYEAECQKLGFASGNKLPESDNK